MLVLWINKHGRCVTITQSYNHLNDFDCCPCVLVSTTHWHRVNILSFYKDTPDYWCFCCDGYRRLRSKIWNLTDWLYVILKEKLLFEWAHHRLKNNYVIGAPIMIGRHYSHYEQFILPESMRFFYLTGGGGCCPYHPNQNGARLSNTI